jgi:hypothetical protein
LRKSSIIHTLSPEAEFLDVIGTKVFLLGNGFYSPRPLHIGMPHSCEMVLVKKLELETTEMNLKNNNHKVHTPALAYK